MRLTTSGLGRSFTKKASNAGANKYFSALGACEFLNNRIVRQLRRKCPLGTTSRYFSQAHKVIEATEPLQLIEKHTHLKATVAKSHRPGVPDWRHVGDGTDPAAKTVRSANPSEVEIEPGELTDTYWVPKSCGEATDREFAERETTIEMTVLTDPLVTMSGKGVTSVDAAGEPVATAACACTGSAVFPDVRA